MRRKVVLYNPRTVFWTMPLALIAIGSALDRERYVPALVDGRLEVDPLATLLNHIDDGAVCLGITVLTGAPIHDAVAVSRAVKNLRPDLPVLWGGWHPSIFPEQCLSEPGVDAVVVGQGEDTFVEVVDRLAAGMPLDGVQGCATRDLRGIAAQCRPRPLKDINLLPAHDYGLADVESYFQRKGKRQFDYVSSQGCRFRCAFCADPTVFQRNWHGLAPERIARELAAHMRAYRFEEIAFQDETFFSTPARVEAITAAMIQNQVTVPWTATMRSDQGARIEDGLLARCRHAGLKRVMIGAESGSPETLLRIQKDITLPQIFDCAQKCARHGIGAILNFIVGFPDESDDDIRQTLSAAAQLRALSPEFEVSLFYFQPYPGTVLAQQLVRGGYELPGTLAGWADFDYVAGRGRWITEAQRKRIERFKFYQRFAFGRDRRGLGRPLKLISRWRIERQHYGFPVEKMIIERLRPAPKLS